MSHDPQTETTLNIPSILVFTILASFLIRYLFFSSAGSNAADRGFGKLDLNMPQGVRLGFAISV